MRTYYDQNEIARNMNVDEEGYEVVPPDIGVSSKEKKESGTDILHMSGASNVVVAVEVLK